MKTSMGGVRTREKVIIGLGEVAGGAERTVKRIVAVERMSSRKKTVNELEIKESMAGLG